MDFDLFNSLFYYDETSESGLRNKITRASRAKINNRTGCVSTDTRGGQCWVVVISGKRVLVHRIVYLLNNGSILSDLQVDHVDGNALNNNINNLRLVNNATNGRNAKMRSNNSTGVTGVSYRSAKKCYVAHYYINRKQENKCFSCKQYGSQQAFRLACEWRANAITAVNNELGDEGYTQQKKCSHDWGEQKYNPYTMKEEQSTGRYEIQGIHMNPISTYIDITMPRWSRMCKKCGSIQHTEAQRQVITYVPDFK